MDSTPLPKSAGTGGLTSDSEKIAPPRLGNLGDALEKYSAWLSQNISPPSSPTLRPSPTLPVIILENERDNAAVEPSSPGSLSSDSDDVSPSRHSASSRTRKTSTAISSPPTLEAKNTPQIIRETRYKLLQPDHGLRPSEAMRRAAQVTPEQVAYARPTFIPPQLLAPVYAQVQVQPQSQGILPMYLASKEQKYAILQKKLALLAHTDGVVRALHPAIFRAGIHVFVDLSNITIGFYDLVKRHRGIPVTKRMPAPPFSFENFALILERGRLAVKRIVAGSVVSAQVRRVPLYMQEAEECGYEMNILQRVQKHTPPPNRRGRRPNNSEPGWTTTSGGDTSDDHTSALRALRQAEQGVDELLHLKLMQSLVDCDKAPGTIVLATGDAAEAEFSDGFKSNVERALNRGWTVELYAWTSGTSSSWKDSEFKLQWGDKFRIVELDGFVEELLAIWTL